MVIKSVNDLQQIINKKVQQAILQTQTEINEVLQKHIDAYYDEYEPSMYVRTYELKENSIIKPKVTLTANGFACTIGFSDEYLEYKYPDIEYEEREKKVHGKFVTNMPEVVTGYDVLVWNNEYAAHGGWKTSDMHVKIWDDFLEEIGGEQGMIDLLKNNMQVVGLPVI